MTTYTVSERWIDTRDPSGQTYHAPDRWDPAIVAADPDAAAAQARADLLAAFGARDYSPEGDHETAAGAGVRLVLHDAEGHETHIDVTREELLAAVEGEGEGDPEHRVTIEAPDAAAAVREALATLLRTEGGDRVRVVVLDGDGDAKAEARITREEIDAE